MGPRLSIRISSGAPSAARSGDRPADRPAGPGLADHRESQDRPAAVGRFILPELRRDAKLNGGVVNDYDVAALAASHLGRRFNPGSAHWR
jgi:hypothetical protein